VIQTWDEDGLGTHSFAARPNIPHFLQHGREAAGVKALRPLRGAQDAALTQAFLLGTFSAMWGMGRCESQPSQPEAMTDVVLNTMVCGSSGVVRRCGGWMLFCHVSHMIPGETRLVAHLRCFVQAVLMLLLSNQLDCRLPRCRYSDRLSK
jgi:hypothetical protein